MKSRQPATKAPTYNILGVQMSVLTLPNAVAHILNAVSSNECGYVCVTGMHGIMEARADTEFQQILNEAFLCTPDGMPTVWIGRARGLPVERVYGPDLMLEVFEATRNMPVKHFFYGGAEGVAESLKTKMEKRFPGIKIVGTYCPPFRPLNDSEFTLLKEKILQSHADIIWVGLSTPKQERFMATYLKLLDTKIMIGVGAAFDFHSGRAIQAPRWIQRAGGEWLFRLLTNPRRLWRRYLIQAPRFAFLVLLDCLGFMSHPADRQKSSSAK